MAAPPDFVLLGPNGFLGTAILRALEGAGCTVVHTRVRLQDRLGLERVLDEHRPSLGVICAAGERGRPNVAWCDAHPVETVDANITGQLNVAAACHKRGLHVTLFGTGSMYERKAEEPKRRFAESDAPNVARPGAYVKLRHLMEELLAFFDNVLILRALYPVSSDLDPRGLLGKLARFRRVDPVVTSATVLEDLCPLIPELVRRRITGPLNFVNRGTVSYVEVLQELAKRCPPGWHKWEEGGGTDGRRPAAELDISRLAAACGCEIPDATVSVRRIIGRLREEDFSPLLQQAPVSKL